MEVRCRGQICDFEISTLFWGALIVLALVVGCLLAGKAIEKLRNRTKLDDVAAEEEQREREQRERDEFLLVHGTEMERRVSKARISQRRQAEQAQQKQSKS